MRELRQTENDVPVLLVRHRARPKHAGDDVMVRVTPARDASRKLALDRNHARSRHPPEAVTPLTAGVKRANVSAWKKRVATPVLALHGFRVSPRSRLHPPLGLR